MVDLNIDRFKSRFLGGARPTLFKATINNWPAVIGPARDKFSYMCKGANLPNSTLGVIEVPYLGRKLKVPGDRTFEPWTVTVINDKDFLVRDSFERWSNAINSHFGNKSSLENIGQIYADLTVEQHDRDGSVLKRITIHDAFPSMISEIELNWESNDVVEEFTVEFQYQYWTHTYGQNGQTTDQASGSSTFELDVGLNVNI